MMLIIVYIRRKVCNFRPFEFVSKYKLSTKKNRKMVSVPTMKIMELEKNIGYFFMGMAASQWGSASSAVAGLFSLRTKELTNHVFNCISTSNSYVVLGPLDPLALKHPTVIFYYYRIHKMCFSYSVKNWSFSVLFLLVNNRGGSPFFL